MTVNDKFFAWLDKLESGEIKQGVGILHKIVIVDDGVEQAQMCCLGVCSSMFAEELGLEVRETQYSVHYDHKAHYPGKDVIQHMGIPESHIVQRSIGWSINVTFPEDLKDRLGDSNLYDNVQYIGVDVLNDNGYSHPEIAALLRKEFAVA